MSTVVADVLPFSREAAMAERWAAGVRGPLRLEDGRGLRVILPGQPGRGPGPDYRDALLDAAGDLLRGDVEFHLLASGWAAHGHATDQAYDGVVLHVVAVNDTAALVTSTAGGRALPVLVLAPSRHGAFPPPFTPPCVFAAASAIDVSSTLVRMSLRRLRMKAARVGPLVADKGPAQALYVLFLEQLAGAANRAEFARLASRLPLAALLERADDHPLAVPASRSQRVAAELRGSAASLSLRRAGLRPLASPGKRLDAAGALVAALWRVGEPPAWPAPLAPGATLPTVAGLGRATAIELMTNAVLPVALASGAWPDAAVEASWRSLSSPGTYGKLRQLEGWLGGGGGDSKPFPRAAHLQGALLLHAEYCTKGMCGRCPLSGVLRP